MGTVTEIADYLRLLFARVGVPHCPKSGKVLEAQTVQEIVDRILERGEGARLALLAPDRARAKGELRAELERLRREGFVRARIDGEQVDLGDEVAARPQRGARPRRRRRPHRREGRRQGPPHRLGRAGAQARRRPLLVDAVDGSEPVGDERAPRQLGVRHLAAAARAAAVLVQRPARRLPGCDGLGVRSRSTRSASCPIETARCAKARSRPGAAAARVAMATEVARVVQALGVDPDVPWQRAARGAARKRSSTDRHGAQAQRRKKRGATRASCRGSQRMLETGEPEEREDDDADDGAIGDEDLGRFVVTRTCEACGGTRLRPEALAVQLGGKNIAELGAHAAARAARVLERARAERGAARRASAPSPSR